MTTLRQATIRAEFTVTFPFDESEPAKDQAEAAALNHQLMPDELYAYEIVGIEGEE